MRDHKVGNQWVRVNGPVDDQVDEPEVEKVTLEERVDDLPNYVDICHAENQMKIDQILTQLALLNTRLDRSSSSTHPPPQ